MVEINIAVIRVRVIMKLSCKLFLGRLILLLLLGVCFWREAPEIAVGPGRRAGKRGRKRRFSEAVSGVPVRKIPTPRQYRTDSGDFRSLCICRKRNFTSRFAKIVFGSGSFGESAGRSQVY